jgi:hypothetical protein
MTEELKDRMEFDHVIEVHRDGTVTDAEGQFAPDLMDDQIQSPEWTFFSAGYTGQYSYNGPIMHDSEYIGGRLEADILANPGYYAAVVSHYSECPDCEGIEDEDYICDNDHDEGWAVVFKPSAETE